MIILTGEVTGYMRSFILQSASVSLALAFLILASPVDSNACDARSEGGPGVCEMSVESLMKSPRNHTGRIKVAGMVRSISPAHKIFGLVDRDEKKCNTKKCSIMVLPVSWDKPMPAVKDEVLLEGSLKSVDGRLLFVAVSMEKLGVFDERLAEAESR